MEKKLICKEWFEKINFDQDYNATRDAMLSIDGILKKAESCCIMNGLTGIGYVDKTGLIDEWYEILERLIDVVENGVGPYITEEMDIPFRDSMTEIYNKMCKLALDEYYTEKEVPFSTSVDMNQLKVTTFKDLVGVTGAIFATNENTLGSMLGIYQEQYNIYMKSHNDVEFNEFIQMNCSFNNAATTSEKTHKLISNIGCIPFCDYADLVDALFYSLDKDYKNAAAAVALAVPVLDNVALFGKVGKKVTKVFSEATAKMMEKVTMKAIKAKKILSATFKSVSVKKVTSQELDAALDETLEAIEKNADEIIEGGLNSVDDIIKGVENGDILLENTIQKGNYGEMKMDVYFESQGYKRVSLDKVTDLNATTHQGIDGVYYNPDGIPPYIIGEAKYGSSKLSTLADGTKQMSAQWIEGGKTTPRLEISVGKDVADDILMEGYSSKLVNIDSKGNIISCDLDAAGEKIK